MFETWNSGLSLLDSLELVCLTSGDTGEVNHRCRCIELIVVGEGSEWDKRREGQWQTDPI